MAPHFADLLVRGTALAAMALYFASMVRWLRLAAFSRGTPLRTPSLRPTGANPQFLWSLGCVVFLLHVLFAFGYVHGWSHRTAERATANETEAVFGVPWGGGIYFNYAFAVLWLLDVFRTRWDRRPVDGMAWFTHLFMAFMVFFATVVFGGRLARALGVLGFIASAVSWRRAWATSISNPSP